MANFQLPKLRAEDDLFGPTRGSVPAKFQSIPYQTYSKSEKLGTIVDWSSNLSSTTAASSGHGYSTRRLRTTNGLDGESGLYGYRNEEDEASFSLVDSGGKAGKGGRSTGGSGLGAIGRSAAYNRANAQRGGQRGGQQSGRYGTQQNGRAQNGGQRGAAGRRGASRGGWGGRFDARGDQRTSRESSVQVTDKWALLQEIEFSRLAKLRLEVETEDVDTISQHGFLYEYDRAYDRVSTKSEKTLQHMERLHYNPSASDDPILQQLAAKDRARVFTTDIVLSTIMCAQRSVYPWDIVLTREGDKLWMDKRESGPLDYLSVNENASDPPLEVNSNQLDPSNPTAALNTPNALSQQATFLNENFAWQVVKESQATKLDFEHPNPFYDPDENEPLASCGYRYRHFDLSTSEDEGLGLIVRTEVDALLRGGLSSVSTAASTSGEEETFITLKTLYEFDSRAQGSGGAPDWRTKLDSQRGAVVATEMKNNSLKLARWATSSVLAGAGGMKIGYVSRINARDVSRHTILGTQWFKPRDLASQMNVSLANGWGIVRTIVDLCLQQKEGKYVLLKDPNKPVIRLYAVPLGTFEEGDGDVDVDEADNKSETDADY